MCLQNTKYYLIFELVPNISIFTNYEHQVSKTRVHLNDTHNDKRSKIVILQC